MKLLHVLAWVSVFYSFFFFYEELVERLRPLIRPRIHWDGSICILRDLREKLESGFLPENKEWEFLKRIEPPWGYLCFENLSELRQGGIPVVPTLVRFEKMLSEQRKADQDARSKSAQAWGQAAVCGAVVPLIALALYFLVPGLNEMGGSWLLLSGFAVLLDAFAMLWMITLAESARWAGLRPDRRDWWVSAICFSERLLGSLRSGTPADLAWSKAVPHLRQQSQDLALFWGADIWSEPAHANVRFETSERALINHGSRIRKAIQISVYEGRGCSERIEAAIESLRLELTSEVDRQLQLLPTQALKPLFFCVAPSILMLLVFAFGLTWERWVLV